MTAPNRRRQIFHANYPFLASFAPSASTQQAMVDESRQGCPAYESRNGYRVEESGAPFGAVMAVTFMRADHSPADAEALSNPRFKVNRKLRCRNSPRSKPYGADLLP